MSPARLEPADGLPSEASAQSEREWGTLFADQLTSVRKSAENWRTGLVGILGLVSIFSVIEGPNTVQELETWAVWVTGLAVLASALFAVMGAVAALHAAFGLPRVITRAEFLSLGGQQGFDLKVADESRTSLGTAKKFTYVSLFAIAVAIAVTWYSPTRATDLVKVTTTSGRVVCGSLVTSAKGVLQIDSQTAGSTMVKLSDVDTLKNPASCDE